MDSGTMGCDAPRGETRVCLPAAVGAWGTPGFVDTLKREMEALGPARFPLQQGLSSSSYALDSAFAVMPIGAVEVAGTVRARVGVFFSGITAGCNCADDPTPVEPQDEYCELLVAIDSASGQARVSVARDAE